MNVPDFHIANMRLMPQTATVGTNLYAWCGNNPVNMVDPSGQIGIMDIIYIGVAVGYGIYQAVDQVMDYVGGDLDYYWDSAWDYAEETWDDVWSEHSCYEEPAPPPPASLKAPTGSSVGFVAPLPRYGYSFGEGTE